VGNWKNSYVKSRLFNLDHNVLVDINLIKRWIWTSLSFLEVGCVLYSWFLNFCEVELTQNVLVFGESQLEFEFGLGRIYRFRILKMVFDQVYDAE
jgi:hypothetical protein